MYMLVTNISAVTPNTYNLSNNIFWALPWQGLRGCIPPNFPYFAVEMGLSSGHVHVIDDEAAFPDGFGRGVLIGLLQLPPEDMHRSAKQESTAVQVCACAICLSAETIAELQSTPAINERERMLFLICEGGTSLITAETSLTRKTNCVRMKRVSGSCFSFQNSVGM